MHFDLRSPTLLVLEQKPTPLYAMAILCAVAGCAVMLLGNGRESMFAGAVIVASGAIAALKAKHLVHLLDTEAQELTIHSTGIFGTTVRTIPLSEVRDIALDFNGDEGSSERTCRLFWLLRDGTKVSCQSYETEDVEQCERAQRRVRAMLPPG